MPVGITPRYMLWKWPAMQREGRMYIVTLEPCSHTGKTPPCSDALIRAGVKRVVAGMGDPNPQVNGGGLRALKLAGIETFCGVSGG